VSDERWGFTQISAWAEIDGEEIPLVGLRIDYGLNTIPRAECLLPVGRDVQSLTASSANTRFAAIVEPVSIKIYTQCRNQAGGSGAFLGISEEPQLVFEGETSGIGYARGASAMQLSIQCRHWLTALEESSIISQSSSPSNPGCFTTGALEQSSELGGRPWAGLADASRLITGASVRADLWNSALLPYFKSLAKKDPFWARAIAIKGSDLPDAGKNLEALDALNRMSTPQGFPILGISALAIDADLAGKIASDIAARTGDPETLSHQTFWDVLVASCAPEYLFAVVPRISDALVVPFIPTYRNKFADIFSDDVSDVSLSRPTTRALRGFGLLSSLSTTTGADMKPQGDATPGIGGFYSAGRPGMIRLESGPRWTTDLLTASRYSAAAAGAKGTTISTADRPEAAPTREGATPAAAARDRAKNLIGPFLDRYARARYAAEILRGRMGTVSGLYRLDIAPGSTVRVQGAGEQFIADEDSAGQGFYGTVVRVSIAIDAEARKAGTAFHIAHVRSDQENEQDATSIDSHPLYGTAFSGASLIS
jgi:hypothetical protein